MNPERINIKDLTIEEPEKQVDLPFDSERDITGKDWGKMQEQLNIFYETENWSDFCRLFKDMKDIDPSNKFLADYKIEQEAQQDIIKNVEGHPGSGFWVDYAMVAAALKSMQPNMDGAIHIEQGRWKAMVDILKYYAKNRGSEFGTAATALGAYMKILDGHKSVTVNEIIDWEYLQDNLKEFKRDSRWAEFMEMAKNMKIINPTVNLGLDEEIWESLREELGKSKIDNVVGWSQLAKEAVAMKVLAAEKVEVTDHGLEITMSSKQAPLEVEALKIPEQRNF